MANTKIDVFQEFEDTHLKHLQVVYLAHYEFNCEEIRKWTNYAVSTIHSYLRKFADLLEEAIKTFQRITNKLKNQLLGGRELVYLFKFFGIEDKLICSKVGTTTRLPSQRLKEEIRYYQKHNIPVVKAEICAVIDCGNLPAEGAESQLRAYFIKRFPNAFCKNDRFFGVDIPIKEFNKVVRGYLE